jgi:hypothetical protein
MDKPTCEFKIEFVERCPKCGGFHPSRKKHTKWTNAKMALPDTDRVVLVKTNLDESISIGRYLRNNNRWNVQPPFSDWYYTESGVICWREFPKPPEIKGR